MQINLTKYLFIQLLLNNKEFLVKVQIYKKIVINFDKKYLLPLINNMILFIVTWRGGRVAEGARLLIVFRSNLNEGSNPSLSNAKN